MSFFEQPILNTPYLVPQKHWELDADGRPTDTVILKRRRSDLISAMPKPKSVKGGQQSELELSEVGLEGQDMAYSVTEFVNEMRSQVDAWRQLPNPNDWQVSPITQRLLQHWRAIQKDETQAIRPFFCQIEAVETAIWMTEVAPKMGERGRRIRRRLEAANAEANPDLFRVAMKLATGAGKTTVMAMIIAWQTLNSVRNPNSKTFSRGFLIVTPGITIRDRLRVLLPNDAEIYYQKLNLVPGDLMQDMQRAKIVLTNYHAFKLRERVQIAKGTRSALEGHGDALGTLESEGQMLQRVMPELMGLGRINVINDEAHHCYRERPGGVAQNLTGEEKKEAEENAEAARLWISGIEAAKRKLGVHTVYDLSATPFFLSGSGWVEGTLFPWVISDFSLTDAIECGIVKLPRVPVADNLPGQPEPLYRKLWDAIGKKMPKKTKGAKPDAQSLHLEASGLASGSWPIEIGIATVGKDGQITSTSKLIRPEPTWAEDKWSWESARVHGILRSMLDDAPVAADVAIWFVKQMVGRIAVSDAPSYDGRWLTMLLRIVDPGPRVRIVDFNQLVAVTYDYEGARRVFQTLGALPVPHRAAADAERLARAFVAGKST